MLGRRTTAQTEMAAKKQQQKDTHGTEQLPPKAKSIFPESLRDFSLPYPFIERVALNTKFNFNRLDLRQPAQNTSKVVY